jgi:hypothetical protein
MLPYHNVTQADRILKTFEKFIDQSVSPRVLANHVRKIAGIETVITVDRSPIVESNDIILNAFYDLEEDIDGGKPFEVSLVFNPNDKLIKLDRVQMRDFTGRLIEYLEHEMIHRAQYQSRSYKANRMYRSLATDPVIREEQQYLGDTDEIEAYAANLARELMRKTSNYDHTLRLLRNFAATAMTRDQAGRLLSPNLYAYFKAFNFDTTHAVLKRLLKKTYQHVNYQKRMEERSNRIKERNAQIEQQTQKFNETQQSLDNNQSTKYTAIIGS